MSDTVTGILFLILIVITVAIGPILLIWAMNTLFGLAIEYSFSTWAAAFVLGGVVSARVGS